jgi:hypothetical protein
VNHDRVDLLLDINRDYTSFWRLTVDHRGWTGESVLGDRSWNPRWYVAQRSDGETWTVEAAIPLDELGPGPQTGDAWAVGVQRVVPGAGLQSWTHGAEHGAGAEPRPQEFGLLLFEWHEPDTSPKHQF